MSTRPVMLAMLMLTAAGSASAQVIGTFAWQTQPFCNVLAITIVQQGALFQLTGQDTLCGAGTAPVVGTAVVAGSNVVMGLTVSLPSGRAEHLSATVALTNVSGTWADADGHSGPFAFGASTGGSARPAPTTAALITSAQLSPAIFGGTGAAATVARSDHDHDTRYAGRQVSLQVSPYAMKFVGGETLAGMSGCLTSATASATGQVPLSLPRGATLNAVDVRVLDGPAATPYSLFLALDQVFPAGNGSQSLASATGGGASNTIVTHTLTPATVATVAAGRTYRVGLTTGGASANALCAVEVHYTLPPAP
ncbi:MAG: hypothetical protein R3E72_13050 [Steroidobacteraceae bacterium]